MNKLFAIGIICITVTIFYGFSSLSYKANTLIDPQAHCCNYSQCNLQPCSSNSTVALKPNCYPDVDITCFDCIYYTARRQVCLDPPINCCILGDGVTLYCGGDNPLGIEK